MKTIIYLKPVIFELGNVSELTAGGKSNRAETGEDVCIDVNKKVITHTFPQPKL